MDSQLASGEVRDSPYLIDRFKTRAAGYDYFHANVGGRFRACANQFPVLFASVFKPEIAAEPALATSSSCCALFAPLTPIAPTICPSCTIGTPPCRGVKSGSAVMVKRPLLMISSKSLVAFLKTAAVWALPIDTLAP